MTDVTLTWHDEDHDEMQGATGAFRISNQVTHRLLPADRRPIDAIATECGFRRDRRRWWLWISMAEGAPERFVLAMGAAGWDPESHGVHRPAEVPHVLAHHQIRRPRHQRSAA